MTLVDGTTFENPAAGGTEAEAAAAAEAEAAVAEAVDAEAAAEETAPVRGGGKKKRKSTSSDAEMEAFLGALRSTPIPKDEPEVAGPEVEPPVRTTVRMQEARAAKQAALILLTLILTLILLARARARALVLALTLSLTRRRGPRLLARPRHRTSSG